MYGFSRRELLVGAAAAAAATFAAAQEQWTPNRPLTIVVPFSPGGPTDAIARALADRLGSALGQPVVVENRPGAGGAIAYERLMRSAPDGYTLGLMGSSMVANAALGPVPYDPVRSFTPIAQLFNLEILLVVRPEIPARTMPELIAHLKKNPGRVNYGSSGLGSLTNVQMEVLKALTGTHIVHIPYRGSSGTVQDLLGGQLQMAFDTIATFGPHIKSGSLRVIAVANPRRSAAFPTVPTVAESDPRLRDFDVTAWSGLGGPAGIPAPVVARLHREVENMLKEDAFIKRLEAAGAAPAPASTPAFAKRIADEQRRYAGMLQKLGLDKSK